MDNHVKIEIDAKLKNEAYIRTAAASFAVEMNPTLDEINDIKTAVSEAVTNCVVHGYNGDSDNKITVECSINGDVLEIIIIDSGVGIENIEEAVKPFFTTKPDDERSGMGFTVMQSFMDSVKVKSALNKGTTITMLKRIASK